MPQPPQIALRGERRCRICPQPPRPGRQLCTGCEASLDHALDPSWDGDPQRRIPASIPVYWSQLDPTPGRTGQQDRRAPGFHSAPPCSLTAVVMRDDRSRPDPVGEYDQAGELRPIELALANLATEIWDRAGMAGPTLGNGDVTAASRRKSAWRVTGAGTVLDPDLTAVRALCGWLHAHLPLIVASREVAQISHFVHGLLEQLRNACGDPADRAVGECTRWVTQVRGERMLCGHPIYPPVPSERQGNDPAITHCERCGQGYGLMDILRMQELQKQSA